MFTQEELDQIDASYFKIIKAGNHTVTLQSKNTKHCWHILHQEYPHFKSCKIYHTHKENTAYHEHGSAPTLAQAINEIREHDTFQLNTRKKSKHKKSS